MNCSYCADSIDLTDVNCKSLRLSGRWIHYHLDCFKTIIGKPVKPSGYKSINNSQIRTDNFSKS